MNALLKAQLRYDNAEPADDSAEQEALQRWIDDAAERLARGEDIKVSRRGWHVATVTHADFLLRVQEHLTCRLDQDDDLNFAQLVVDAMCGNARQAMARRLLGPTDHSLGVLHEIAESMVKHLAEAGVEQDRADDEL
ncbi:hypothetical protein [Pseudomonas massiliensis]|uniref:hypothetical protein n=1 Tax=Pseudomonas massiliensis TaxID=522492 RepID=UPI000590F4D8|nr:hypothetical protein [Pseudomonas massiliensis]